RRDARAFRRPRVSADFAAQLSAGEWAPDDCANLLIASERHELPLVVARDERVVRLMRDISRPPVVIGDAERLHEMPARKVRASPVAHFSGAHDVANHPKRFVDGCEGVEAVHRPEIDVVGAESPKTRLERGNEMLARRADVVGTWTGAERRLRRDQ